MFISATYMKAAEINIVEHLHESSRNKTEEYYCPYKVFT
jgi:hypothetical protein